MEQERPHAARPAAHVAGLLAFTRARQRRKRRERIVLVTVTATTLLVTVAVGLTVWRPSRPADESSAGLAPAASGTTAAPGSPEITVAGEAITLDGVRVASATDAAALGRVARVDGLFTALRQRRLGRPDDSRRAVIRVEADVPAIVVKSVFQTIALAGYPDVELATTPTEPRRSGARGRGGAMQR